MQQQRHSTVFVGNISFEVSEEMLIDLFREVGEIVSFRFVVVYVLCAFLVHTCTCVRFKCVVCYFYVVFLFLLCSFFRAFVRRSSDFTSASRQVGQRQRDRQAQRVWLLRVSRSRGGNECSAQSQRPRDGRSRFAGVCVWIVFAWPVCVERTHTHARALRSIWPIRRQTIHRECRLVAAAVALAVVVAVRVATTCAVAACRRNNCRTNNNKCRSRCRPTKRRRRECVPIVCRASFGVRSHVFFCLSFVSLLCCADLALSRGLDAVATVVDDCQHENADRTSARPGATGQPPALRRCTFDRRRRRRFSCRIRNWRTRCCRRRSFSAWSSPTSCSSCWRSTPPRRPLSQRRRRQRSSRP